jgi:glycosyltransferase involved in cell wall biosynthesis
LRIVHYYRRALDESSGVVAAITSWVDAGAIAGIPSIVLCQAGDLEHDYACPVQVIPHSSGGRLRSLPRNLREYLHPGDVLYLHEGWVTSLYAAAHAARIVKVPIVLMPHGSYDGQVVANMRLGRTRLRFERRLMHRAAFVHALTPAEAEAVRAVAPKARVKILPTPMTPTAARWRGGGGYIAWFGRYDLHSKGLDLLLLALASIPLAERPRIIFHGYDFLRNQEKLEALTTNLGLADSVEIRGRIDGDEKIAFLQACSAYVHPSRFDALPIALLEAMNLGVPCIVSSRVALAAALEQAGAGDMVNPLDASALAHRLLNLPDIMVGGRGRQYVIDHLAPALVGAELLQTLQTL